MTEAANKHPRLPDTPKTYHAHEQMQEEVLPPLCMHADDDGQAKPDTVMSSHSRGVHKAYRAQSPDKWRPQNRAEAMLIQSSSSKNLMAPSPDSSRQGKG